MALTTTLFDSAYPVNGWSSWWGGQGTDRPGCLGIAYQLSSPGVGGITLPLLDGVTFYYQNGGFSSNLFRSKWTWPVSSFVASFRFANWNIPANTVEIQTVWWATTDPVFPGWLTFDTITIPTARETFTIPAPGDSPFFYPASIVDPVTFRPLNRAGLKLFQRDP